MELVMASFKMAITYFISLLKAIIGLYNYFMFCYFPIEPD